MDKIKDRDIKIDESKIMPKYRFQSAVLDWLARIEELLEEIRTLLYGKP